MRRRQRREFKMTPKKKLAADEVVPPRSGSGVAPPRSDPDRIWMSIERTYNVAAYESLKVSVGGSSSVEPGETIATATRRVFDEIRGEFADMVEVIREDGRI